MNVHGKFGYREPEAAITQEYIAKEAKKIKAGDRSTWMIPIRDRNSPTLARTPKKRRLTETAGFPLKNSVFCAVSYGNACGTVSRRF